MKVEELRDRIEAVIPTEPYAVRDRLVEAMMLIADEHARTEAVKVTPEGASFALPQGDRRALEAGIAYPIGWVERVATSADGILAPLLIAGAEGAFEMAGTALARLGHGGKDISDVCADIRRREATFARFMQSSHVKPSELARLKKRGS